MGRAKIKIFNTLGRKKEKVRPPRDGVVRIYSCGPTVYDFPHIGNWRKYIFDDFLRRVLMLGGYKTKQVMNVTDVGHLTSDADTGEDKIEKGARREGKTAREIARFYERVFWDELKTLNILAPDIVCRATDHIAEQIVLIEKLEKKGFTYIISDGVYFDTAKSFDYGKLAGLKLEDQREGARVERNPEKRNPSDFALWKFSPKGKKRQMEWSSPWGVGFPGWHIECSAMSAKYLGQPFEIHTGGIDHIPIHHTNEIAQSEAAEGKPLAKYWVHSEHLLEGGRKMAKSAGRFSRLEDLSERDFSPLDFRFFCLGAHYRSKLDFSFAALRSAQGALLALRRFVRLANLEKSRKGGEDFWRSEEEKFKDILFDDLDSPRALASVFGAISFAKEKSWFGAGAIDFFKTFESVFAVGAFEPKAISAEVKELARRRDALRRRGEYSQADTLRDKIKELGFEVEDRDDKTVVY